MKILIINPTQFGYSAGYYHYCKYLAGINNQIDYFCLDNKMPRVNLPNVRVKYLDVSDSLLNWRILFNNCISKIQFNKYDVVFLNHQKFAFLYRIYGVPYRAIIDIRTGDLAQNKLIRYLFNLLFKFDTLFFNHITVISNSLLKKLNLNPNKCMILPLGAEIMSNSPKEYYPPHFLYVGTLNKRNIGHTIEGLILFSEKYPEVKIKYDIIGFGDKSEELQLKTLINKSKLNGRITFHGRKGYPELRPFYEAANIGLSYIPMTSYYDCQPPTKIFEYILSGIICIATRTSENKKYITPVNGILCDDNPESLFQAIEEYYINRYVFNSNKIRESLSDHQWENIINSELEPLFSSVAIHKRPDDRKAK